MALPYEYVSISKQMMVSLRIIIRQWATRWTAPQSIMLCLAVAWIVQMSEFHTWREVWISVCRHQNVIHALKDSCFNREVWPSWKANTVFCKKWFGIEDVTATGCLARLVVAKTIKDICTAKRCWNSEKLCYSKVAVCQQPKELN